MFVRYTTGTAVLLYAVVAFLILFSGSPVHATHTTEVSPQNIPIKLFYNGAKLTIKGESDADNDLIILISSAPTDAHMKFKGKAAGLFWMKMGDISFEHVPATYILATSGELDTMLPGNAQIEEGIGYEAIKARTKVEASVPEMNPDHWIEEFVRFKQSEKLYQIKEGVITRPNGINSNIYQLDIDWPYQAFPGTYDIEVLAVRNGHVVARAETNLTVERAGLVAKLSYLAFNQAAVYGIVAIVVAMAAGFAVGALFKKGGGAH